MDNNAGRVKIHVRRIGVGTVVEDVREKNNVRTSKNRCFLAYCPEGQFLLRENELTKNCVHLGGSPIRPSAIEYERLTTVYYVPTMDVLAAAQ